MRIAIVAALLALAACRAETAPVKPELYVMTSLPLLFDEGFTAGPAKGEAAVFLSEHYALKPIDLPSQLPPGAILLAAQPRALPAEELVALDAWVRGGGKMLLLADPLLEWPSERPLGDQMRPPMAYPDTGLLAHWGLRLDAPEPPTSATQFSTKEIWVGRYYIRTESPGIFVVISPGACSTQANGLLASCRLGKGRAEIVADADFLNLGDGETSPGRAPNAFWFGELLDRLVGTS